MKSIDPLTKLGVGFLVIGFATVDERSTDLALLSLLIAGLLLLIERMPIRAFLFGLLPFAFFAVSSSWIYAVAPGNIYGWTGWDVALMVGLRTIAVGLTSMAFAYTTEPADLGRVLVHRARLPRRFVYGTLAAIQFLPALAEDARMARTIARASIAGVPSRLRLMLAGFNPTLGMTLLAGAVRRAGAAALAMELRGLSASGSATAWRVQRFQRRDLAFIVVAIAALAATRYLGAALG